MERLESYNELTFSGINGYQFLKHADLNNLFFLEKQNALQKKLILSQLAQFLKDSDVILRHIHTMQNHTKWKQLISNYKLGQLYMGESIGQSYTPLGSWL